MRRQLQVLIDVCFPDCRGLALSGSDWRWLAVFGGEVVGSAAIRRQKIHSSHGELLTVGHLAYFSTLPAYRGLGFGGRLLEHIKGDAPALGLSAIVLHSTAAAVKVYRRCGWQKVAPAGAYRGEDGSILEEDRDPVLAWTVEEKMLARLRCDRFVFDQDW
jgi:ribosomal protein S18 acetylase RimI-like enzyme